MVVRKTFPYLLAALLLGCQALPGGPAAPATTGDNRLVVTINPGFRTAVASAHVNLRYRVDLLKYNTVSLQWEEQQTGSITSSNFATVQFGNVHAGDYKAVVQAFLSPTDLYNVTKKGYVESATQTITNDGSTDTKTVSVTVPLLDDGRMDGTDAGDVTLMHGFTLPPTNSQFVWIPRFTAYELINPTNCGTRSRYTIADNARPVGYYVGSRPNAGQEGTDWMPVTLGGFYVGKYEACRSDASNLIEGIATTPAVKDSVVPWTGVTWNDAMDICRKFSPQAGLISDAEWTTLAIWAQMTNTVVKGNNNNGSDVDGGVTFTDDPVHNLGGGGRTLTGSGGVATSHSGASDGVYDLHGNVAEWTSDLAVAGDGTLVFRDIPTGMAAPVGGSRITGLSSIARPRRMGLPGTLDSTGVPAFGNDVFTLTNNAANRSLRGGSFLSNPQNGAGLWNLALDTAGSTSGAHIGFRPVLRY